MDYMAKYEAWLASAAVDDDLKSELLSIAGNDDEIKERFFSDLSFGTGGLRGIIGAGTSRINKYTVGRATAGLAEYIIKSGKKDKGVAIAYDVRKMSSAFARHAALVLCAKGIKTYIYEDVRPVPVLSFTVRHLSCAAGIVITASHNPPEYNGYKVYWSDGGQVAPPLDFEIIETINNLPEGPVPIMDEGAARDAGLYNVIGEELDASYDKAVLSELLNPDIIEKIAENFTIVYTSLHGAGLKPMKRLLSAAGFKNVYVVPEQAVYDEGFKTLTSPNPEEPSAFTLALKLAKEVSADIILATDPDADRIGVMARDSAGNYVKLTGNMTGALLAEYIVSQKKEKNALPENAAMIKTIVSSGIIDKIGDFFGVKVFNVLTGFKYIGNLMTKFQKTGEYSYVFGFEESYGCLCGTYARDKDAPGAGLMMCELGAFCKSAGITIPDYLENIYKKYGYYNEKVFSITLKGLSGAEKIKRIMSWLRENPPIYICNIDVLWFEDYDRRIFKNLLTGETEPCLLPPSDVLKYILKDGSWFCIRPSGTEPKIKIYSSAKAGTAEGANKKASEMENAIMEIIENVD